MPNAGQLEFYYWVAKKGHLKITPARAPTMGIKNFLGSTLPRLQMLPSLIYFHGFLIIFYYYIKKSPPQDTKEV